MKLALFVSVFTLTINICPRKGNSAGGETGRDRKKQFGAALEGGKINELKWINPGESTRASKHSRYWNISLKQWRRNGLGDEYSFRNTRRASNENNS